MKRMKNSVRFPDKSSGCVLVGVILGGSCNKCTGIAGLIPGQSLGGRWLCLCCQDRGNTGLQLRTHSCQAIPSVPPQQGTLGTLLWGSGAPENPSRSLPGKAVLEFCDKVEVEKESDVLGAEGMFSVTCTVKSASTGSWGFTVLYFRDPTFQIVIPTSVPAEGSKTLEISESHLEPQRAESLEASPGGLSGALINPLSAGGEAGKPVNSTK